MESVPTRKVKACIVSQKCCTTARGPSMMLAMLHSCNVGRMESKEKTNSKNEIIPTASL